MTFSINTPHRVISRQMIKLNDWIMNWYKDCKEWQLMIASIEICTCARRCLHFPHTRIRVLNILHFIFSMKSSLSFHRRSRLFKKPFSLMSSRKRLEYKDEIMFRTFNNIALTSLKNITADRSSSRFAILIFSNVI